MPATPNLTRNLRPLLETRAHRLLPFRRVGAVTSRHLLATLSGPPRANRLPWVPTPAVSTAAAGPSSWVPNVVVVDGAYGWLSARATPRVLQWLMLLRLRWHPHRRCRRPWPRRRRGPRVRPASCLGIPRAHFRDPLQVPPATSTRPFASATAAFRTLLPPFHDWIDHHLHVAVRADHGFGRRVLVEDVTLMSFPGRLLSYGTALFAVPHSPFLRKTHNFSRCQIIVSLWTLRFAAP